MAGSVDAGTHFHRRAAGLAEIAAALGRPLYRRWAPQPGQAIRIEAKRISGI